MDPKEQARLDPEAEQAARTEPRQLGGSLLGMSRLASGQGLATAALMLRLAGDALLQRGEAAATPPDPSSQLYRLLYVSRPTTMEPVLAAGRAKEILEVAQWHNAQAGLTGALLRSRRWFAQVLEGECAALDSLYARIQADPRHCELRLLLRTPINNRAFTGWAMADAGDAPDRLIRRALEEIVASGLHHTTLRELLALMRGRVRLALASA